MGSARILLLAVAGLFPGAALAGDPTPQAAMPSEHRLTPDEIEAVLADAARKRDSRGGAVAEGLSEQEARPIPIQGEFGISMGTDGYRAVHGTAVVGLPGDGAAIISMGTERLPDASGHYWYPGW